MVNRKYLTAGLILAAAVAVVLIFFVDWEARAVKKQLRSIAKQMTWAPVDSELTMALRIKHVQEKIAQTCQVEIPTYKVSQSVSRNDVPTYMMMARNYYKDLSVELEDLDVQSVDLPQAQAVATAYVKATGADGRRDDAVLALQFRLQKIEQKWQVTEATEIKVLER